MPIWEPVEPRPPSGESTTFPFHASTVVVFSGGSAPDPRVVAQLPEQRFVIAADGGHQHARNLGVTVDLLVGDFDSLDPTDLEVAKASTTEVLQHRVDKDATDLELALDLAIDRSPGEIIVVGGGEGERLDHFVSTISLLGDPRYARSQVSAWLGHSRIVVVRPGHPARLSRVGIDPPYATNATNAPYVSLVPVSDTVDGITTSGLRFALENASLLRHRTRGVSNEFIDVGRNATASVEIRTGALLVIQPFALPFARPIPVPVAAAPSKGASSTPAPSIFPNHTSLGPT